MPNLKPIDMTAARPNQALVLALPRGRILRELTPLLGRAGIEPEAAFADAGARQLRFGTNHPRLDIIRVRSFDVATFVAFGAAHLGVVGNDVLMEFDYPELYAPVDLGIGHCRIAVAEPRDLVESDDPTRWSHIRVATKYPGITRAHFAARGVQAECIELSGAMELAPGLGLCRRSGLDRDDAGGQRPGRGRDHRPGDLAPDRQPGRAQDPAGGGQPLDRRVPGGRRCPVGWTRARPASRPPSRPSSRSSATPRPTSWES
jgi:ATP phosphoribosyltransferase